MLDILREPNPNDSLPNVQKEAQEMRGDAIGIRYNTNRDTIIADLRDGSHATLSGMLDRTDVQEGHENELDLFCHQMHIELPAGVNLATLKTDPNFILEGNSVKFTVYERPSYNPEMIETITLALLQQWREGKEKASCEFAWRSKVNQKEYTIHWKGHNITGEDADNHSVQLPSVGLLENRGNWRRLYKEYWGYTVANEDFTGSTLKFLNQKTGALTRDEWRVWASELYDKNIAFIESQAAIEFVRDWNDYLVPVEKVFSIH